MSKVKDLEDIALVYDACLKAARQEIFEKSIKDYEEANGTIRVTQRILYDQHLDARGFLCKPVTVELPTLVRVLVLPSALEWDVLRWFDDGHTLTPRWRVRVLDSVRDLARRDGESYVLGPQYSVMCKNDAPGWSSPE